MERYIDTHVHFYDEAFADDADAAIKRAEDNGVFKMIQADVDSAGRDSMLRISAKHPGVIYSMLGLYPGSVKDNWEEELGLMLDRFDSAPVAIGEIGLDYHYSAETADLQKLALKEQLRLAAMKKLPVNIHLRDATEDFFAVLEECRHMDLHGNLHAFSGSADTFRRLQKYGTWLVGIGGVITFKNSRLAETVKDIPLEYIVLETDAPYLTPAPHRGERNESAYIPLIAAKIAEAKNIPVEQVAEQTSKNAIQLFSLK